MENIVVEDAETLFVVSTSTRMIFVFDAKELQIRRLVNGKRKTKIKPKSQKMAWRLS